MEERKMIKVRRGGSSLLVPEVDKQRYLDIGYNVIDNSGRVVEEAIANDVPTLQSKCRELETENQALKAQLQEVKNKLDELSKPKKTSKKTTTKKKED